MNLKVQQIRHYTAILAVFSLCALALSLLFAHIKPVHVEAQGQPAFTCNNNLYLSQNQTDTQLNTLNISVSPATLTAIGAPVATGYNAMGFQFSDGYIYAYHISSDEFARIGSDGTASLVGSAAGIPVLTGNASYAAADMDANGYHNMLSFAGTSGVGNPNQWVITDVTTTPDPTMLGEFILTNDTGGGVSIGDVAFNPRDGNFYGMDNVNNRVAMIDITGTASGTITHLPTVNTFSGTNPHGAAYINTKGELVTVQNSPGEIYVSTIGTNGNGSGAARSLSTAPDVNQNDGASCPYVPLIEKIADPDQVVAGDRTTYHYTIYNPIPNQSLSMTFNDKLEDGRTYVGDTLSGAFGGTANSYGGTDTLTITGLTVPAGSSVVVTVQIQVPENTPTGTLWNQACISSFSVGSLDPEVCSDYPITSIFGDQTPIYVTAKPPEVIPGVPNAGLANKSPWVVFAAMALLGTTIYMGFVLSKKHLPKKR